MISDIARLRSARRTIGLMVRQDLKQLYRRYRLGFVWTLGEPFLLALLPAALGPLRGLAIEHQLARRAVVDPAHPVHQARRVLLVHQLGEAHLHAVGDGEVADVGERVLLAGEPRAHRQARFELPDRVGDLAHLLVEHLLREALARAPPLDLLLLQRDVRHHLVELGFAEVLHHVADHAVPADGRHAPAEVLVDPLGPHAHLRLAVGVDRAQRRAGRQLVLEVFADHRRLGDDLAVVVEHRHLAVGIDLLEPVRVVLELAGVQEHALELQALLVEREQGLERIRAGSEAVERQHVFTPAGAIPPAWARRGPRPARGCLGNPGPGPGTVPGVQY